MAATVNLYETNGAIATPTTTLLTNLNFSNVDTPNTTVSAVSNPLVIAAGIILADQVDSDWHFGVVDHSRLETSRSGTRPEARGQRPKESGRTNAYPTGYGNKYVIAYGHKAMVGWQLSTMPRCWRACHSGLTNDAIGWNGANNQMATSPSQNLGTAGSLTSGTLVVGGGAPRYSDFLALGSGTTSSRCLGWDAVAQTISYSWDESYMAVAIPFEPLWQATIGPSIGAERVCSTVT